VNAAPATAPILDVAGSIERAMRVLVAPGQVVELRALGVTLPGQPARAVLAGYFDDVAAFARAAADLDGFARGIYWTLNPLTPACLSRAPNRLAAGARAACDEDVLARRWLPLDLDPVREPNTNATEDELAAAIERADLVWRELRKRWPGEEPVAMLSGNGTHLLYRYDAPADDAETVRDLLRQLSREFSDDTVKLDPAVSNASRIWKVPSTLARKGPASPLRPYRRAAFLGGPPWR